MKIAIVSEASADEAAVKILVDAIVGRESEAVDLRIRPNGWPHVLKLLPSIVFQLHYWTDIEALVVVVDTDESPIHQGAHELNQGDHQECRLCLLRITLRNALNRVRAVPNRSPLKTALGVAVPTIEAWYRCGIDPHVTEFEWARKLGGEVLTYDKRSLKISAYGSDPSSNFHRTRIGEEAARRLAFNLDQLELCFPTGFGALVRDVRGW